MLSTVLFSIALFGMASGAGKPAAPSWEPVFQGEKGPDGWVSAVVAIGRDDFFVSGGWGITRSTSGRLQRRDTPGHGIFGLVDANPDGIFALGAGELILHFNGTAWVEEHAGAAVPPRTKSPDSLLYSAFQTCAEGSTIAFGPKRILERHDSSWRAVSGAERERFWDLVRGWPSLGATRPARCDAGSWFWLANGVAWSTCQDGRTFQVDCGKLTPKARKPTKCQTLSAAASAAGRIYASCANGTLWEVTSDAWRPLTPPKGAGKELGSISVADDCLFVAASRTVWRRCGVTSP